MSTLQPQTTLQGGKYKIISTLGQGGFGITYLAEQVMLGRKVAIKEFFYKECCDRERGTSRVTLGTQSNRETVQRFMNKFLKEARTISQLDHPNIIKIYDVFEENNTAYYVMEYIEGENLSEMVKRQGALSEVTAVEYIKKVADALAYIHARSINHLDVKPGNIMLRQRDNQIVLIDFGLSKQYDDVGSQTSSTPIGISQGYAPIEQYSPSGVAQFSPQTDIYSLGATLYWLIVGKTPPNAHEVLNGGLPSMPPYVPVPVKKTIERAMQARKVDRTSSVDAFLENLGEVKSVPTPSLSNRVTSNDDETRVLHASSLNSDVSHDSYKKQSENGSMNDGIRGDGWSESNGIMKWRFTLAVKVILIANLLLYVLAYWICPFFPLDGHIDWFLNINALHPIEYGGFVIYQYITYMFMHGGWWHLFFCMWSLMIFGNTVEQQIGTRRFWFYYLICGIGSALVHQLCTYFEIIPPSLLVGASGAIYGVMTAAVIFFPNTKLYIIPFPLPVKLKYLVGFYTLLELSLGITTIDGVAHFAHLGGILVGAIILLIWKMSGKKK